METGSDALSLSYNSTQLGFNTLRNGLDCIVPFLTNLAAISFDVISITYPSVSSEVYALVSGGATGTTQATFTVLYSDATKYRVTSVTKT